MKNTLKSNENGQKNVIQKIFFPIKIIFTLVIIVFILINIDWKRIPEVIKETNLFLIFIVFILMVINILISAFKWKVLLSIHSIYFSLKELSKYYFIAFFFNNFLPSNIGGDGYRIYKTMKNLNSKTSAFVAVFMERITGILTLLILGLFGGFVGYLYDRDEFSQLAMVIGFASLVITIILFLIIFKKIKINVFNKSKFIPEKLKKLFEKIGDYKNAPSKIYQIILLSFLFHTIFITFRFLLIEAVDANIAIYDLIVATMMSTVVALIPITINGLGLLEGSFIFLLVNYGVIYEKAVIIAILIRLLQIPLSLIGGGFYFFEKKTSKIQSNLQQEIHSI